MECNNMKMHKKLWLYQASELGTTDTGAIHFQGHHSAGKGCFDKVYLIHSVFKIK